MFNIKSKYFSYRFFFIVFVLVTFIFSCRKEDLITDDASAKLTFSTDSILFDTVFTTIGSVTKQLKVYNYNDKTIRISSICLAGGSSSNFRININGMPYVSASNIDIEAGDSMYIFVKVTVDPTNSNNPMVIADSIIFNTNDNIQDIKLAAWGQDAHYVVADQVLGGSLHYKIVAGEGEDITWANDKPYVIYGYAVVDSTGILRIDAGTRVHFYNGSGLWIYKGGCLKVNGTCDEPVTFQGSRLEMEYRDEPGQWDRIWINEGSVDNVIDHAIIKNGFIGIQAETMDAGMGNQLILKNTQILNMSGIGLLSRFYHITSINSVFSNCALYAVCLTTGGIYDFRHCTIGNYWSISTRETPSLVLSNYYKDYYSGTIYTGNLDTAYFGNCIIYGDKDEEMLLDNQYGSTFNYKFDYCFLKTKLDISDTVYYTGCTKNSNPLFKDYSADNYELDSISPAIDYGDATITGTIATDIKCNARIAGLSPDLGAYEWIP